MGMRSTRGGMQSSAANDLYCKCGKPTSKIMRFVDNSGYKEIAIHFGKERTYWHICVGGKITRTFKMPAEWKSDYRR